MTVVTPGLFRSTIQKYVGCEYGFCDRCGGGCHPCQYDCSGLQCKGTNETGLTRNVCTSSFVIADQCYDLGLLVAWEDVDEFDGLWWIRGDDLGRVDNGSKANGASGHIVYRVRHVDPGTGVVTFYTIEAKGRRFGVVNGSTNGRVWDAAYKIPGMSHGPPPPPPSLLERTMIVQKNHYNPDGTARPIPLKDAQGNFILATIIPALDGSCLELDRGSSMRGDQEIDANHRRYVPDDLGGAKIVAICDWVPQDGSVPGGILRYSDGRRRPVRFS